MSISGKLKIVSTGQFQGEAVMSILIIEEGAGFQGQCQQTEKK
jgi:cytoskeletal protein CcmA (bactofilin family)